MTWDQRKALECVCGAFPGKQSGDEGGTPLGASVISLGLDGREAKPNELATQVFNKYINHDRKQYSLTLEEEEEEEGVE